MTQSGPGFQVRVFSDAEALAAAVAERVRTLAEGRRRMGRSLLLGFAAGASVQGVYRALEGLVVSEQLNLSQCIAYGLDEYYPMRPSDPRSYAAQMATVAAGLGLRREALRVFSSDLPREGVAVHCARYEQGIRASGGVDLQLLGVGRSGHIGFNEPGASRDSRTRIVQLDERTRLDAADAFGGLSHVPREAITRGVAPILEAKEVALIALGEAKAAIIRTALLAQFHRPFRRRFYGITRALPYTWITWPQASWTPIAPTRGSAGAGSTPARRAVGTHVAWTTACSTTACTSPSNTSASTIPTTRSSSCCP